MCLMWRNVMKKFKIWRYELANGSTAMNRYYKYSGRYYVKSDYTGSYVSGNYYEHNFFS